MKIKKLNRQNIRGRILSILSIYQKISFRIRLLNRAVQNGGAPDILLSEIEKYRTRVSRELRALVRSADPRDRRPFSGGDGAAS